MLNEIKYVFTTHKKSYLKKPTKGPEIIPFIVNNLDASDFEEISLQTLKSYVESGFVFSPTIWSDYKRNKNNLLAFSTFLLDFDNKDPEFMITPDEVLDRFKVLDVVPNFIYYTLSHTPEIPKFRVGFCLDEPICNQDLSNLNKSQTDNIDRIYKLFQSFFRVGKIGSHVDKKINAASFFFGGTNFEILNNKPISIRSLYALLDSSVNIYSKNNLSSPCPFQEDISGRSVGLSISIIDTSTKSPIVFDGGDAEYDLKITNHIESLEASICPEILERLITKHQEDSQNKNTNWGWILLSNKIRILEDFVTGKRKFMHDELFRLATNLIPICGGKKIMVNAMNLYSKNHPINSYDPNKIDVLKWVKKHRLHPYALSSFSEHEEDWYHGNIIHAITTPSRRVIDHLTDIQPITVDQARLELKQLYAIAEASDKKISIIKAPTGLGKTECLKQHFTDAVVSTKNNQLKTEIAKRLDCVYYTPEYPDFENEKVEEIIRKFNHLGLYQNSSKVIYDIYDGKIKVSVEDLMKARHYVEQNQRCYGGSPERLITTHSRGARSHEKFSHPTIVFDEDPIGELLKIQKAKFTDLLHLADLDPQFHREFEYFMDKDAHQLYKYEPSYKMDDQVLRELIVTSHDKLEGNSHIYQMLKSDYFIKTDANTILFAQHNRLPENKKVVITSATPNIEIFKNIYAEEVEVLSIDHVQSVGKIIQDHSISYSKQSIISERNTVPVKQKVAEINDNPEIEAVITFKNCKHLFPDKDTSVHFFSSEGTDRLNGKTIAVFGTPIPNPDYVLLYAAICGVDVSKEEIRKMSYRRVTYNNFTFRFNTFVDPDLSRIHLSLIEQELIQAAGRNRYLTEHCKVYLYSSFPIRTFKDDCAEVINTRKAA